MSERLVHRVAIALGANLGYPSLTISRAAGRLSAEGVRDVRLSDLFETEPVGCIPGTPPFVNAALTGTWRGTPEALLRTCQALEAEFGRPRLHSQREARLLDLDIVLFGQVRMAWPCLTIPHPRMAQRLFVLAPLAQLAGSWPVPGTGCTVAELHARELARQGPNWGRRLQARPGHFG